MKRSIQRTDLCGYYLFDYCLRLKRPCLNVKPEDCPASKELLELIQTK